MHGRERPKPAAASSSLPKSLSKSSIANIDLDIKVNDAATIIKEIIDHRSHVGHLRLPVLHMVLISCGYMVLEVSLGDHGLAR